MNDWSWVPEAASAIIAIGALVFAVRADAKAREADARAERVERIERVRLELVRDPNEASVFAFINRGTDTVEGLEIDASSVAGVAFKGSLHVSRLVPAARSYPFQLGEYGVTPKLREPIRVTWTHPFQGEQYVPLPDDPNERWSYTIYD